MKTAKERPVGARIDRAYGAIAALSTAMLSASVFGAQYDATEYQALMAEAQLKGAVRIMVSLDVDVGLQESVVRRALIANIVPLKTQA